MRRLPAATRQHLRAALAGSALDPEVLAFIEAVVLQVARPLGAGRRRGILRREGELGDRVLALLTASLGDEETVERAAGELAADFPLLSAFFQNLDLLPASGSTSADAIPLLVVMALSRLEE